MSKRPALVVSVFALTLQAGGAAAAPCTATALSKAEARMLMLKIPEAILIRGTGGTVEPTDSDAKGTYPHSIFYNFMLQTSNTQGTLLDNGLIGYYAVNRISGGVVNLMLDPGEVLGPELTKAQLLLRKKHCIDPHMVDANRNLSPMINR